jgi:hypothetical protein
MDTGAASQPTKQRVYRFSLYVKKRSDISEEEFGRHWRESHVPLTGEWLKRYGILRYVQVCVPRVMWQSVLIVENASF